VILDPLDDDMGEGPVQPASSRSAWLERLLVVASAGTDVGLNRKFWPGSSRFVLSAAAGHRPAKEGSRQ
jgi:hypothetical protein